MSAQSHIIKTTLSLGSVDTSVMSYDLTMVLTVDVHVALPARWRDAFGQLAFDLQTECVDSVLMINEFNVMIVRYNYDKIAW